MDLDRISTALSAELDAKFKAREKALPLCRAAIRHCANSIRAIHREEREQAEELMRKAREGLDQAAEAMSGHPDIRHAGYYHDASKEYAEARITFALVFGATFPGPEEIGVEPAAYLNGMGEAVGEIRRHMLDLMRHGDLERSEGLLTAMDDIFYLLTAMDYPDAMTGGLRRTTDVARSIIERTRGDLSTTIIQKGLQDALTQARQAPLPE